MQIDFLMGMMMLLVFHALSTSLYSLTHTGLAQASRCTNWNIATITVQLSRVAAMTHTQWTNGRTDVNCKLSLLSVKLLVSRFEIVQSSVWGLDKCMRRQQWKSGANPTRPLLLGKQARRIRRQRRKHKYIYKVRSVNIKLMFHLKRVRGSKRLFADLMEHTSREVRTVAE